MLSFISSNALSLTHSLYLCDSLLFCALITSFGLIFNPCHALSDYHWINKSCKQLFSLYQVVPIRKVFNSKQNIRQGTMGQIEVSLRGQFFSTLSKHYWGQFVEQKLMQDPTLGVTKFQLAPLVTHCCATQVGLRCPRNPPLGLLKGTRVQKWIPMCLQTPIWLQKCIAKSYILMDFSLNNRSKMAWNYHCRKLNKKVIIF